MTDAASDREKVIEEIRHTYESIPVSYRTGTIGELFIVLADRDRLLQQRYDEAWAHAACLTIAETGQKWGDSVQPSLAMQAVYELRKDRDRLAEELAEWKPLTPEEAEKAFDEAEAVPISEERIQEIVKRALDPAERLPNSEQAQLAARNRRLAEENARLRKHHDLERNGSELVQRRD